MGAARGDEVKIKLLNEDPLYVAAPAVVVEVAGVGRVEVGAPNREQLGDAPPQVVEADPMFIAVIDADGQMTAGSAGHDGPGLLASVPTQPPGEADDLTHVVWAPLPAEVDVVVFQSGRFRSWQHPISGIAAFPWPVGYALSFSLIGLDTAGQELLRESHDLGYLAGNPER